jgi:two-component sensor histidine kinase
MRILVVEDNPDDRTLAMREIRVLFPPARIVEVIDAASFDAAMAMGAPDLVVTDLDLRWSTGRDILAAVKRAYPDCPVVMFTGTGDETIAVELMKAGLDDYVVKSPRHLQRLRISLKFAVDMSTNRTALTDREAQLTRALAQQQVVSRELHHRVKNNLQTMSSMLRMRSKLASEETRAYLNDIAGRMEALASVQSHIYASLDLGRVDFRATLVEIAASLIRAHRHGRVLLDKSVMAPLALDVARAMPLSMISYEIILNAMKHAWPGGEAGTLTIAIVDSSGQVEIVISDDGVGFVEQTVVWGLGNRLNQSLAQEAGARYELVTAPGSGTRVTMNLH